MGDDPATETEFLGTHRHSMDAKGRLVLPASFRKILEKGLVMTVGFDPCVIVQTPTEWDRTRVQLRDLNSANAEERQFARVVTSSAERTGVDNQGRISIPKIHREYAGLAKDVVAVGVDNRVELWNAERWDVHYAEGLAALRQMSEKFGVKIL